MTASGPGVPPERGGAPTGLLGEWRGKGLRAVFGNTGWVLFEKVARAILSAIVSAWIARYLGPSQFATIAYALTIAAFFGPFAQLGLTSIVVRDLARHPDKAGKIVGTALILRLLAGVASFLLATGFLFASEASPEARLVGALIAGQLVFQASEAIDFWFQSRLESRFGVRARMVVSLAMAAIRVALILLEMPLWTFALALLLEFVLIALALVLAFRLHRATMPLQFDPAWARTVLREGRAFMLSGLAIMTYLRVDQFFIRHIAGAEALGLYAAAVALAQVWQVLPTSAITSFAPAIAREAEKGEAEYFRALRAMFILLGTMSLVVTGGIALFAGLAVWLLLGDAYAAAVPVLQVYGLTNVAVAMGSAWNVWASTSGKGRLLLLNTVAGGIVAVVANLILIPRFGIMGAAIAANLSFFTSAWLMNFFTCREIFFLQIGIVRKPRVRT